MVGFGGVDGVVVLGGVGWWQVVWVARSGVMRVRGVL